MRTTPPGGTRLVALYDGHCRICTREAKRLARLAGEDKVDLRSIHGPEVLDAFPGITCDAAMARIHVITPDGEVYAGAEAIARLVMRIPAVGALAWVYYVPGVRQVAEAGYTLLAKYRYKFGKMKCTDGTCHLPPH